MFLYTWYTFGVKWSNFNFHSNRNNTRRIWENPLLLNTPEGPAWTVFQRSKCTNAIRLRKVRFVYNVQFLSNITWRSRCFLLSFEIIPLLCGFVAVGQSPQEELGIQERTPTCKCWAFICAHVEETHHFSFMIRISPTTSRFRWWHRYFSRCELTFESLLPHARTNHCSSWDYWATCVASILLVYQSEDWFSLWSLFAIQTRGLNVHWYVSDRACEHLVWSGGVQLHPETEQHSSRADATKTECASCGCQQLSSRLGITECVRSQVQSLIWPLRRKEPNAKVLKRIPHWENKGLKFPFHSHIYPLFWRGNFSIFILTSPPSP